MSEVSTVVVVGKESSGKSSLVSSLTGRTAISSNFRGTTVSCDVFTIAGREFIDTPGILLQSDTQTTSIALDKLERSENVLLVLKASQLADDLREMIPLVKEKRVAGVITFWDKVPPQPNRERILQDLSQKTGISLIPVDARHLSETNKQEINKSLDNAANNVNASAVLETHWITKQPRKTVLESKRLGALFGLILLLLPAIVAVWCANNFANFLDPYIENLSRFLVRGLANVGSPWKEVLIGRYGFLTMGPLLFVWAVPTVVLYALVVGSYKASGLLDRITVALHPLMRSLGMTGRDLVRIVMGYGCNVPAVINTRCCSSSTRNTTISAIGFGSACSYQFGATLAVFAAIHRPFLVAPFLAYLILSTIVYARAVAGKSARSPLLVLCMDKPTFLEWPRLKNIWAEARLTIFHFLKRAMPIFIAITFIASILDWLGIISVLAKWVSPAMRAFNLPATAATAIVFSCIRKDAILLFTNDAGFASLRNGQILTAVFMAGVLLPCIVTVLTIGREKSPRFALRLIARQAAAAIAFSLILAWSTRLLNI